MNPFSQIPRERRCEIAGILVLALATLLFLALATDGYRGEIHRELDNMGGVPNALGKVGSVVAGVLSLLLGHSAHLLYCILAIWGFTLFGHTPLDRLAARLVGLVLLVLCASMLLHMDGPLILGGDSSGERPALMGGMFGGFLASLVVPYLGIVAAHVVAVALLLVGILLSTEFLFFQVLTRLHLLGYATLKALLVLIKACVAAVATLLKEAAAAIWKLRSILPRRPAARPRESFLRTAGTAETASWRAFPGPDMGETPKLPTERPVDIPTLDREPEFPFSDVPAIPSENSSGMKGAGATGPVESAPVSSVSAMESRREHLYPKRYTKPSIDLFDVPPKPVREDLGERLRKTSAVLEETLATFGIEARVVEVTLGPTVTRYELEPAPGIKVSRFVSLADDLALALKAYRVRVEAPIPGKGRVGVEVPNLHREPVVIREVLDSQEFKNARGILPLALGKDITGEAVTVDLATMPHLLVAGATGAGKTVCVKTMIASLLFTHTPEEVQLMLIDPKMVELSVFNDIPHLIAPVVADPKKAAAALRWLINEMDERYRLFTHLRVRNIEVYNRSVDNGELETPRSHRDREDSVDIIRKLPYVVCVIDELADLMMMARAEVEDAIARLAQLARAVGIHLILATQRPSVDVLTGVIKANFPARISFQVSSKVDSRCILDQIGAERLIGKGDMLYLPPGHSKAVRIQGAYISDEETNRLIVYLKTQARPQYRAEVSFLLKGKEALERSEEEEDELFDEAVRVVLETGQASISMVQRRLRVGYTRAARLIDMMEVKGIVGPHVGSKAREILVQATSNGEVA